MKKIIEYECEWCEQRFEDKEDCFEHESECEEIQNIAYKQLKEKELI